MSAVAFFGLVAPKDTPKEIVDALNREVIAMFKTPAFQEQMRAQALTLPAERSPEQFSAYLADEVAHWKKVVEQAQVSIE